MSKHSEGQWKVLRQLGTNSSEKDKTRSRVRESIRTGASLKANRSFIHIKSALAAALLILICGGFLFIVQMENSHQGNQQRAAEGQSIGEDLFSWELKDVSSEKSGESLLLYRENNSVPVGEVNEVSAEEKNVLIRNRPMFIEEELKHFPYETAMYIEHVKMEDTAVRYHFFLPYGQEGFLHFSFDYPKLEHAEVFLAMSTISLKGSEPYIHGEQIYVKHGYGAMLFPAGLEPISILHSQKEVYHWEAASEDAFNQYAERLGAGHGDGTWGKDLNENPSYTYKSADGNEVITIVLDEKELTYKFQYPNRSDQ